MNSDRREDNWHSVSLEQLVQKLLENHLGHLAAEWKQATDRPRAKVIVKQYLAVVERLYQLGWDSKIKPEAQLPKDQMPKEYAKRSASDDRLPSIWENYRLFCERLYRGWEPDYWYNCGSDIDALTRNLLDRYLAYLTAEWWRTPGEEQNKSEAIVQQFHEVWRHLDRLGWDIPLNLEDELPEEFMPEKYLRQYPMSHTPTEAWEDVEKYYRDLYEETGDEFYDLSGKTREYYKSLSPESQSDDEE